MKLNPNKTSSSSEVDHDAIKPDKLFWIEQKTDDLNLQKQLLLIHNLSREFPNSGSLITALTQYFKGIEPLANLNMSPIPAISIVLDIAINNPRVYAISTAILSKLLSFVGAKEQKELIGKIKNRFDLVSNTGHLQIWLQRITITSDPKQIYNEPLCRIPAGLSPVIWNSEWLAGSLGDLIDPDSIYNERAAKELKPVIENIEVDLFMAQPYP